MKTPLLLNAKEAAEYSGYGTVQRFSGAVYRGKRPLTCDAKTIPYLWSRAEIEACFPVNSEPAIDPGTAALNKRFGIK